MKRFYSLSILLISITFLLASCGLGDAKEKAEKQAAKYHKFLKAGNENAMLDMVHEDGMKNAEEDFRFLMHKMATETTISKIEKSSQFNTSIENGVATVRLNYRLYDKIHGRITEEIVFQDSKDGVMKIVALNYK
ncbi:MAG: hypothetical protein NXI10_03060 [bacterium]|nr:hypothetical protein [bacterium]